MRSQVISVVTISKACFLSAKLQFGYKKTLSAFKGKIAEKKSSAKKDVLSTIRLCGLTYILTSSMGLICQFTGLLNKNMSYYSNIYIIGCTYAASEIQKTNLLCEPLYFTSAIF